MKKDRERKLKKAKLTHFTKNKLEVLIVGWKVQKLIFVSYLRARAVWGVYTLDVDSGFFPAKMSVRRGD